MMKLTTSVVVAAVILAVFFAGAYYLSLPPKYFDNASPVLYFYQDSCTHCIAMKPILYQLADEGYRLKGINFASQPDLYTQYGVTGTPTFVGTNTGTRLDGEQNITALRQFLDDNKAKIG